LWANRKKLRLIRLKEKEIDWVVVVARYGDTKWFYGEEL
jgi:hypothetical protein